MSYKIQIFDTVYPGMVDLFQRMSPDIDRKSYRELHSAFTALCLDADFERHLSSLGCDVQQVYLSVKPVQAAWAREHGVPWPEENWARNIVVEQVRQFQPDIVYLQDLDFFDAELRREIRSVCRGRVFMFGWRFCPTTDYKAYCDLDLILTGNPAYVNQFKAVGMNVSLLRLAYEHTKCGASNGLESTNYPFTFIGTVGSPDGPHARRYEFIERLLSTTKLEVWGDITDGDPGRSLRSKLRLARRWLAGNRTIRPIPLKTRFSKRCHGPVFGPAYVEMLQRSKVTLNVHAACADEYTGNIRLFEGTGFGACLLTDAKRDLCELFVPDEEVVAYSSTDECAEKVHYLMDHDNIRASIAAAGCRRARKDHTWEVRSAEMLDILKQCLSTASQ